MNKINQLLNEYKSISIIGMCKNAGKTTAMNRIIDDFFEKDEVLGLTSIGRDGESTDRVTGTKKPGIYVRRGTVLATAAGLLESCDITREILMTTGIPTPMGEVVILRALSDGNVELAGPSMVDQLVNIKNWFFELGAERVIIDGAISRKTLCSRRLSDATVLCTGASCGKSMEAVVEETRHSCNILMLPPVDEPGLEEAAEENGERKFVMTGQSMATADSFIQLEDELKKGGYRAVFISGALSESLMSSIVRTTADIKGMTFVARDASKIMISRAVLEKLSIRGCRLGVLDSVNLAAITVNPFSAYGYHFDKDSFLAAMRAAVAVPTFDVEGRDFA